MTVIQTKNANETKKVASMLAQEAIGAEQDSALVIALEGDLGAGKTTFVQGFARALGIKEVIHSPTFLILKTYKIQNKKYKIRHLVHIDCYRLDSSDELLHLGFKEILKDKDAIVLIEWGDRVHTLLPRDSVWIRFEHGSSSDERFIKFKNQNERLTCKKH